VLLHRLAPNVGDSMRIVLIPFYRIGHSLGERDNGQCAGLHLSQPEG
jgi:hypothetical protein